jgi:hypothetical protein
MNDDSIYLLKDSGDLEKVRKHSYDNEGLLQELIEKYPELLAGEQINPDEPVRVEAAARRALKFKTCSYRSMKAILSAGLDRQPDNGEQPRLPGLPPHQNIRGQEYYQ